MAKIAVVMYRCDGCGTTGEPEPYPEHSRTPVRLRKELLPEDWVELRAIGNKMVGGSDILYLQFCPKCTVEASRLLTGMCLANDGVEAQSFKNVINCYDKKEDK